MNILQVALVVEKWAAKQAPITIRHERCLNTRQKDACSACALVCPTGAIAFEDGVQVQQETCIQCGLCLQQCPTGVFWGDDEAYRLLYCVSQIVDHERIELACKFHPSPAQGNRKTDAVLITTRCLSALSMPVYAALFGMGVQKVGVRLDACANCTLAPLAPSIENTITDAKRLVEGLVIETEPPGRWAKSRPTYEIKNPPLSRRAVFQKFLGVTPPEDVAAAFKDVADHDESLIPLVRRQMLAVLRALPQPRSEAELPAQLFTRMKVSDTCTACGLCSRVCPTHALQAREDHDTFTLEFSTAQCTNCGLCIDLCKEQAIARDGVPTIAEVLNEQTTVLHTGTLRHCPKCRAAYTGEGEFCPACTYRRQNLFGVGPRDTARNGGQIVE